MPNDETGDRPLSANIDERSGGERETRRRKAGERGEARRPGEEGTPGSWRERARERGRRLAGWVRGQGPVAFLPAAAAGGLVLGLLAGPRRKGFPIVMPIVAAWLLLRRRGLRLPAG